MLSQASERFDCFGSIRSPDVISETTSEVDLPWKGEFVSNRKFAQPRKRRRMLISSASISPQPAKPKASVIFPPGA